MDMKCKDELQLRMLCRRIRSWYRTGSTVIGGADASSDEDYVIDHPSAEAALLPLDLELPPTHSPTGERYAGEKRFMSFKYRTSEELPWINLIIVEDGLDLKAWKYATTQCTGDPRALDRSFRKLMFGDALNRFFRLHRKDERAVWKDLCNADIQNLT